MATPPIASPQRDVVCFERCKTPRNAMEISGLAFWWLDCFDGCRNPAKHHRLDVKKHQLVNAGVLKHWKGFSLFGVVV